MGDQEARPSIRMLVTEKERKNIYLGRWYKEKRAWVWAVATMLVALGWMLAVFLSPLGDRYAGGATPDKILCILVLALPALAIAIAHSRWDGKRFRRYMEEEVAKEDRPDEQNPTS